jgi:hypothetical protein
MQIPSCEYLEMRPLERYDFIVTDFLKGCIDQTITIEDFLMKAFMMEGGIPWEPYCAKRDSGCIVLESPVISMQGYQGLYQLLLFTLVNSGRIEGCDDSKVGVYYSSPLFFLLNHMVPPQSLKDESMSQTHEGPSYKSN